MDLDRSPDDAKIKQKMLFAASKDALRRGLVGVATEIQGTDFSEVAYESSTSFIQSLHLLSTCARTVTDHLFPTFFLLTITSHSIAEGLSQWLE